MTRKFTPPPDLEQKIAAAQLHSKARANQTKRGATMPNTGATQSIGDYREETRHGFEVAAIARMASEAMRQEYYRGVARARGEASAQALREAVWQEMRG